MSVYATEQRKQKNTCTNRGVALDMDGVLIDGMQFHIKAWKKAFSIYNIEVTPTEVYLLEGIKSPEVVETICRKKDIPLTSIEKNNIVDVKRKIHREIFRVVSLPGSARLVRNLHSYGYDLVLVTGTSKEAAEKTLSELHIGSYFSNIVTSETVGKGKPSPEPYLQARSMLDVNPANCLVVENSPPGIASAKSARLSCIAIATYLEAKHLSEADKVFGNIEECALWFESEFTRSRGQGVWTFLL